MTSYDKYRCDCCCNQRKPNEASCTHEKPGRHCGPSNGCGHNGCYWLLAIAEAAANEARRIDSGLTRSHKPPDNLDAPGKAESSSHKTHVKLQADRLVGKETITLQEYLKETNGNQQQQQ